MALAVYTKAPPRKLKLKIPKSREYYKKRDRAFFSLISAVGLICILFAVYPFITWQLFVAPRLSSVINQAPIPQTQVLSTGQVLSKNVQVVQDKDGFSYFTTNYKPNGPRPTEFYLTIPKLKIEKAKVAVDSQRFDENLGHFPGAPLPGEIGNVFITGHSVLPEFYDPKNYRTIFTKLSDLEIGDDIYAQINGQTIHYIVQYAKIVDPRDLTVLAPISQNGKNLTLMTCVPPGTSTKRLVVITSLI